MVDLAVVTDIVNVLRELVRDARSADRTRDEGVPRSVLDLLSALSAPAGDLAPEDGATGVRITSLAHAAGMGVPTISRQASAAEARGLVFRTADPADARAARLHLSPAGEVAVAEHRTRRASELQAMLDDWSPEDAEHLLALLRQLRASTRDRVHERTTTPA